MPELPEVETVRRGLEKLILEKKIASLDIRYPKMIKTDLDQFQKELPGQVVKSMGRRGKYLLFYLTEGLDFASANGRKVFLLSRPSS